MRQRKMPFFSWTINGLGLIISFVPAESQTVTKIRGEDAMSNQPFSISLKIAICFTFAAVFLAGCDARLNGGETAADDSSVAVGEEYVAARNMRLVGPHDLQARSAYQPIVHAYGDRRILFVGQHAGEGLNPDTGVVEINGVSILDVTDPTSPRMLRHLPPTGDQANGAQHVQVCNGSDLPDGDPNRVYLMRTNGLLSYELFDVTDPA